MSKTDQFQELKEALEKLQAAQKTCPSCGHCPTCGRSASPWYPIYPSYPRPHPWWQDTYISWTTNTPTVTCGPTANGNTVTFFGDTKGTYAE